MAIFDLYISGFIQRGVWLYSPEGDEDFKGKNIVSYVKIMLEHCDTVSMYYKLEQCLPTFERPRPGK
jgi:hypothetical protein